MLLLLFLAGMFSTVSAVVNGTAASPNAFPYMVSLQWDGNHKCGGTLLNNNTVLTAAHCYPLIFVDPSQPQKASAVMGSVDQTSAGTPAQRRPLGKAIWLPGFRKEWKTMALFNAGKPRDMHKFASLDYLIFKLDGPPVYESDSIKFAKLPGPLPQTGDKCIIMGWGRSKHPDIGDKWRNDFPAKLQTGDAVLANKSVCVKDQVLRPQYLCVPEKQVAGEFKGMVCFGDSGGPMECESNGEKYVTGIVHSAANPCNFPDVPMRFLSISYRADWIKQNM